MRFFNLGEGSQVSVYDYIQNCLLDTKTIFECSSIHGIMKEDNSKIIFYGAKSFRTYLFHPVESNCLAEFTKEVHLEDWIHDIQWIKKGKEITNTLAVISAHNKLSLMDIHGRISHTFHCVENCILYSANIICSEIDAIVLAVGTVFKSVLLWSPYSKNKISSKGVPFHQLTGHQGVIFSISFSAIHSIICSTSDDRSVRVWKVLNESESNSGTLKFWEEADIHLVNVLFAHESRVWKAVALSNCILSIGEDSSICFWSIDGVLLKRNKCHKGGSVWCLETTKSTENCSGDVDANNYIAFTGGSDGGVYMWNVLSICKSKSINQITFPSKNVSDFPRFICLLCEDSSNYLLATTEQGWLLSYNLNMKQWSKIFYESSLRSYCVPSLSNENKFIALGNITGDIFLVNLTNNSPDQYSFQKFTVHKTKIFSIHWIDQRNKYLLSCGVEGHMVLMKITFKNRDFLGENLNQFYLPKYRGHWWSTAALYLTSINCIVVGDKGGSISLYNCSSKNKSDNDKLIYPCMTHRYIHGENGVTDIQEHKSLVYTSGRDGKVQLYAYTDNSLNLLHIIKVSHNLEWIGKMLFYADDLLLLGFHTKDFIVWSTQLESSVMGVECGGGHRSWDFRLTNDGHATFSAIKKKDIIYCNSDLQHLLKNSILKPGITGYEFCCATYLYTQVVSSSDHMSVFACGGEDNALRIIGFLTHSEKSQIISLRALSGHLSSIRAVGAVKSRQQNSHLLVSVGGRSQMMIWKLDNTSEIQCEQLFSHIILQSESQSLSKKNKYSSVVPQTRLMDISVIASEAFGDDKNAFLIAVACSDSYLRVFSFNDETKILNLYYNLQVGDNCILRLEMMTRVQSSSQHLYFITAATNGFLEIFKHQDYVPKSQNLSSMQNSLNSHHIIHFKAHVHQSGINALHVKPIDDKLWLICTAGDDNSITVMLVNFLDTSSFIQTVAKCSVLDAHASQITGVRILGRHTIASTSVDQRLNIWKWEFSDESITVKLEESIMSSIPDIANIESWENEMMDGWTILLCGQGIEVLDFKPNLL